MKHIYEKLAEELAERGFRAKIIAVGRGALELYGIKSEYTQDIDFELIADEKVWEYINEILSNIKVRADFGEDFDRWSVVPMPEGYRERAVEVIRRGEVSICVLDPVDYVISKLRRGTEEDERDAEKVVKKYGIKRKDLEERLKKIRPLKDVEFFLFRERVSRFIKKLL